MVMRSASTCPRAITAILSWLLILTDLVHDQSFAVTARDGDQFPRLNFITHHNSGTMVGRDYFYRVCEKPKAQTLSIYYCEDQNILYRMDGMDNDRTAIKPDDYLFHLTRHPLDMLVSGYLHHRSCSEYWTIDGSTNPGRFPPDFPSAWSRSYCASLKHMNATEGLKAELWRSLFSDDGIGKMLKDMRYAEDNMNSSRVLQLCLATYREEGEQIKVKRFLQPWLPRGSSDNMVEERPEHATNVDAHYNMLSSAFEVIKNEIPEEVLVSFPCRSEYSMFLFPKVYDYLQALGDAPAPAAKAAVAGASAGGAAASDRTAVTAVTDAAVAGALSELDRNITEIVPVNTSQPLFVLFFILMPSNTKHPPEHFF